MAFTRKSLTAALIQVKVNLNGLAYSTDSGMFEAGDDEGKIAHKNIARAQSISTNDELSYAPVFQLGYAGVVEHVPLRTQGSGQMNAIEVINEISLYKIGILDFVGYLVSCSREAINIVLISGCDYNDRGSSNTEIDRLTNVKFTSVARMIDVGGQLVSNAASFVYIRPLAQLSAEAASTDLINSEV